VIKEDRKEKSIKREEDMHINRLAVFIPAMTCRWLPKEV